MYATCIFCHGALGANESIEHFPVGRRLAFDAAKGRLWAVCPRCGRWNLSPLEERWEAIEECERAFRGTTLRTSTEHIGLARLRDGTELVRIGAPQRPEFAAWRYGAQFTGRQKRMWLSTLSVAGAAASLAGGAVLTLAGASVLPLVGLAGLPLAAVAEWRKRGLPRGATELEAGAARQTLVDNEGVPIMERGRVMSRVRLRSRPVGGHAWAVEVHTANHWLDPATGITDPRPRTHMLTGGAALRTLAVLTAEANAIGGSRSQVDGAVRLIDRNFTAERFLARAEEHARELGAGFRDVWALPPELRFALEMASNEDAEKRALEGELAELERHWREAEEVAAIADRLVVPAAVEARLNHLRGAIPPRAPGRGDSSGR
ncbi:hypothetical protein [Longimicrobium terrae]|uniref:Uncharacterized protein n=1 Tax=Longimicrobium terrae TaxID=1639882 RepID=A0A841GMF1_9BACT|nr:hypothetical protein [Longimicrobium terrae]MBB4635403.1 hypothetical protein [Longimicrobium terrae]MBB6069797.1 hypothetical protein [Longimicrobium terrae]NNC30994.1 hypothetical protein [Longimicrobium terrae]